MCQHPSSLHSLCITLRERSLTEVVYLDIHHISPCMHKWISAPAIGIVFRHLSFAVWNTLSLLSYKIFSFNGNLDQMSLTLKVVFPCHEQMEIMNRLSFEFPTRCNTLLKNPYLQIFVHQQPLVSICWKALKKLLMHLRFLAYWNGSKA